MTKNILHKLQNIKFLVISITDLKHLLQKAEVLDEADTYISDYIRILRYADLILVQEQSQKGEIVIRKMETVDEAHVFLANRMEIYEKMWDGCGCKVSYFE